MPGGERARGTKRQADDSFDDEQRFAKRFNLLKLDNDISKLYIPVSPRLQSQATTTAQPARAQKPQDEHMHVDDTKDRVYIHDLDAELAEIESDTGEQKLVFLPDIERKLQKIPKHVLTGQHDSEQHIGHELVLYRPLSALIAPANKNGDYGEVLVNKLRADERAMHGGHESNQTTRPHEINEPETAHGFNEGDYHDGQVEDPDAMDLG